MGAFYRVLMPQGLSARYGYTTLPQVEILMPVKKPRGQELTLEQHVANQALHRRPATDRARQQQCQALSQRCAAIAA